MPIVVWSTALNQKTVCIIYLSATQLPVSHAYFFKYIDLLDSYLNGPRTLSQDRLSYLIISHAQDCTTTSPPTPAHSSSGDEASYDILICATHFLGDGMALHQFANDFFGLLGGPLTRDELSGALAAEWQTRCSKLHGDQVKPESDV